MIALTFPVGPFECNCTILGDEATGLALVIDPGDEPEGILDRLRRHGLELQSILHTHAHLDHIGAAKALAEATGAQVFLHPADRFLFEGAGMQARMLGMDPPDTPPVDRWIEDGDEIRCGSISGSILHTPGHTPGSVCLRLAEAGGGAGAGAGRAPASRLYSGDTLFAGSIGRTDLVGGDARAILRSIRDRLLTLPDETVVVPGHGPTTLIGRERRTNPFIQ